MKKIENELNNRRLYLNDLTEGVKTLLLSSPEGSLRANTKNGKPQYYVRTDTKDRTGKYIKKEDIELAKAIANRDYLKKVEEKAEMELDAIVKLLEILQMGETTRMPTKSAASGLAPKANGTRSSQVM